MSATARSRLWISNAASRPELERFVLSPEAVAAHLADGDAVLAGKEELLTALLGERERLAREAEKVYRLYMADALSVEGFGAKHRPLEERLRQLDEQVPRMPVTRTGLDQTFFRRKLLGYRETWRQGLHRKHLGIPNFRVLTVTTTRSGCDTSSPPAGRSGAVGVLFLFADQHAPDCGGILRDGWQNGHGEVVRLIDSA
jgi:hypothetical protein